MIKYKVSFEITNRVGDSLVGGDRDLFEQKYNEYLEKYKVYVTEMVFKGIEHQHENLDKIKVTDFRIEEVEEND